MVAPSVEVHQTGDLHAARAENDLDIDRDVHDQVEIGRHAAAGLAGGVSPRSCSKALPKNAAAEDGSERRLCRSRSPKSLLPPPKSPPKLPRSVARRIERCCRNPIVPSTVAAKSMPKSLAGAVTGGVALQDAAQIVDRLIELGVAGAQDRLCLQLVLSSVPCANYSS